jgi:hypothetical protein
MKKNSTSIITGPDIGLFEAAAGDPGKPSSRRLKKKPPIKNSSMAPAAN